MPSITPDNGGMMAASNENADPPSASGLLAELSARAGASGHDLPADAGTDAAAAGVSLPLLFLRVGRRWFAVRSETVREVGTKGYVTRVPTAPVHVLGVTLIRGRLVPVLALEGLLGALGTAEVVHTLPRLVVLRHEDTEIALVADETKGIIERRVSTAADGGRSADRPAYLGGEFEWEGKLVCMIDVPALIAEATPGGPRPS
jgi:purine-binding chemotaxis protein CheW